MARVIPEIVEGAFDRGLPVIEEPVRLVLPEGQTVGLECPGRRAVAADLTSVAVDRTIHVLVHVEDDVDAGRAEPLDPLGDAIEVGLVVDARCGLERVPGEQEAREVEAPVPAHACDVVGADPRHALRIVFRGVRDVQAVQDQRATLFVGDVLGIARRRPAGCRSEQRRPDQDDGETAPRLHRSVPRESRAW